jgi:phosphoglycolate phosphatase-like HAD superfamily hydrolase
LLDVSRVARDAYAEAFQRLTGRRLIRLPPPAGRMESEIFFEALALNDPAGAAQAPRADITGGDELLGRFGAEFARAFADRRAQLPEQGRLLPGAAEAVAAVSRLPGVVQSVLTGNFQPNAVVKLDAFGLTRFFDTEVGGYGSQVYPKGAQLLMTRTRAAEKYGVVFDEQHTVYLADSVRDVAAARAGGARCLAIASGRSTVSELRAAGADLVFVDLTDTAAVTAAVDRLTLAAAG